MKTLLLVDGSSYLYRAFHAMPDLRSPTGEPTGALYGVLNMLRRLKQEVPHDYSACVFDAKGKTFRDALFAEYKANRPSMPDDLRAQVAAVHELVESMGWKVLVVDGVEADDVIGTLAKSGEAAGLKVVVSTGDKDMAQLVSPSVSLVNTMSGENLDEEGVKNKFGVPPNRIIDYLALIGDKVDNVPGVDKCGPKTAVKWLSEFDSLDGVVAHASDIGGKVGENLRSALDFLPLAYELVTIKCDVDLADVLPEGMESLRPLKPNWKHLAEGYRKYGFKSWLKEAEQNLPAQNSDSGDLFDVRDSSGSPSLSIPPSLTNTSVESIATPMPPEAFEPRYQAITTEAQFSDLLDRLAKTKVIGIDTETTSLNPFDARLVGISIGFGQGEAVYIPLTHSMASMEQLPFDSTLSRLKPLLEGNTLTKIGQNIKYDQHVFANHGVLLGGIVGDSMLASYVVESHLGHGMDEMALRHLGLETITYESLCGKGAKQIGFAEVSIEDATPYAAQDADFTLRLHDLLLSQMNEKQLELYQDIELPTEKVLWVMERTGVLIDKDELARQSHELGQIMMTLEQQAYELAGQPFNLNSPKQLQEILFDKLNIPTKGLKKTPSGGVSTNESVLEKLALDYPLPKIILQNRSLAKLKSTYTDKLPTLINPQTKRVHTTYAQAVAITGRLASNNPNLQNIPIRTTEGKRVRKAFIAPAGHKIVSADYSQIELRIMAHLSNDEALVSAFNQGEDIHKATAAEVFHVPINEVTSEQRRYAKTINFGLIYGMGQYGLASALEITADAAKQFIDRYFVRYSKVAHYMNQSKADAAANGFVETLFGRRLYLPDIMNSNGNIRAGAERAAINAPMQGTASDLIKLAMIAVFDYLQESGIKSRLIMQVHDELVLEVPNDEVDLIKQKLPELMAGVAKMSVPLLAEVGVGDNWEEAH